jgi:hypothetical protein
MKGLKNVAAKAREENGVKLGTGKPPLSFQAYRAICQWLLEADGPEAVFAHYFLTLTWNLMCRSKNTTRIHRKHIEWENDSLAVGFAHTKTDKAGDNEFRCRHVLCQPRQTCRRFVE